MYEFFRGEVQGQTWPGPGLDLLDLTNAGPGPSEGGPDLKGQQNWSRAAPDRLVDSLAWVVRKQKSHRSVSESAMKALEAWSKNKSVD